MVEEESDDTEDGPGLGCISPDCCRSSTIQVVTSIVRKRITN